MREQTTTLRRLWALLAGGLAITATAPLNAQSLSDWSLPAGPSTQAPSEQGPVDSDHPVITTEQPTPAPRATVRPAPSPDTVRQPDTQSSASPQPSPRPSTPVLPTSRSSEGAAPLAPSVRAGRAQPPPGENATAPPPEEWYPAPDAVAPAPARAIPEGPGWLAWWWTVPAGLLALVTILLVGAGVLNARRKRAIEHNEPDPAPARNETPDASPPTRPTPEPAPAASPVSGAAAPSHAIPAAAFGLTDLDLTHGKLRLSLVYATLPLRLELLTDIPDTRAPFSVHGDLVSAHAGQTAAQDLAPDLNDLSVLGRIAPGQPPLAVDVRLALGAVHPLRQGGPSAFVPLLRLAFVGADGTLLARRAFALGVPGPGGGLQPVRLDLGPRDIAEIAMRPIPLPAPAPAAPNFALDPSRAAV